MGARVGDRRGGLGGDQGQHFLVLGSECFAAGLVGKGEAADLSLPRWRMGMPWKVLEIVQGDTMPSAET